MKTIPTFENDLETGFLAIKNNIPEVVKKVKAIKRRNRVIKILFLLPILSVVIYLVLNVK